MIHKSDTRLTMSNEVATFAIPYKQILSTLVNDEVFLSNSVIAPLLKQVTMVQFIDLVVNTVESWLTDTLVKPLEDHVTGTQTVSTAEELYANVTETHEVNMDIYEYILSYPPLSAYCKAIENRVQSVYDIWSLETTSKYIYVNYVADFRIRYFDRKVKGITVEQYIELKEEV